ncbi:MAG: hypothetical protein J0M11_14170 [Anaerolineae bacterium]|nr:hypothetical protein [Anaerolineae bacterium]
MKHEIDQRVQSLVYKALNEQSGIYRKQEILNLLEPHLDIVIPMFIEKLNDESEDGNIRDNALEALGLSSDNRAVLPVIRFIEIHTGWTGHIFEYFRQGLKEKNKEIQNKFNIKLLTYLKEGPNIPIPPDDSEDRENAKKTIQAISENILNEKNPEKVRMWKLIQKGMSEALNAELLSKPVNDNKIPEYQNILVEVIDTLSEFNGLNISFSEVLLDNLQNSFIGRLYPASSRFSTFSKTIFSKNNYVEGLLSKIVKTYRFDSIASQHALSSLCKIKPSRATSLLGELAASTPLQQDTTIKRVVRHKSNNYTDFFDFTICVHEQNTEKWRERPYYFKYEQGLVFYLARGEETYKWFVGQSQNSDSAIQLAIGYLERWLQNIDDLGIKETQTGKYSRIHVSNRYSECLQTIQQHFDFEKWGFTQTHIAQVYDYPHERPQIIYDSEWCRVKFSYRSYGERYDQSDVLSITYGRLHAADKTDVIFWKGEPHHCWHDISLALCFLDNMSDEEAAKALWDHPIIAEYKKSREMQNISQPNKESEIHAIIWEKYGHRLFELFDLRRPDLWEEYSIFLKQVYDIRGLKHYGHDVPLEKIC